MLGALGWELGRRVNCADWSKVPSVCLAVVQEKKNKAGHLVWHWVVALHDATGQPVVLDPRKSVVANRRRDLAKIELAACHRVW